MAISGSISKQGDVVNFTYSGDVQEFVVPLDGLYQLEVWGAQGGSFGLFYDFPRTQWKTNGRCFGGLGGYSKGYVALKAGQQIFICVGNSPYPGLDMGRQGSFPLFFTMYGGYNGGSGGLAEFVDDGIDQWTELKRCGGGGATHIALTNRGELFNYDLFRSDVLIVAGGGGGATDDVYNIGGEDDDAIWIYPNCNGGTGGGLEGGNGWQPSAYNGGGPPGYGGTQDSGYQFGKGGVKNYSDPHTTSGGNGGGGWYGGVEGSGYTGGGGGSGYIGGCPTLIIGGTTYAPYTANGIQEGDGMARITFMRKTAPTLYIGTQQVDELYYGNVNITEMFVGNTALS